MSDISRGSIKSDVAPQNHEYLPSVMPTDMSIRMTLPQCLVSHVWLKNAKTTLTPSSAFFQIPQEFLPIHQSVAF